ncbi:UNVERIFIED_CONTAM: hypothetical protein HDU68_010803 [Siphonaria sp. JEL0065]|nr:hypothetical protein HDU68_010803 [Siphonaria sp. JEL0065]
MTSGRSRKFSAFTQYNYLTNLMDENTRNADPQIYEAEMRLMVERIYKRFLALQLNNNNATLGTLTCDDCVVVKVFWAPEKKDFVMVILGLNVFCAVLVLVSLMLMGVRRNVTADSMHMIHVIQLEYDVDRVKEKNAEVEMPLQSCARDGAVRMGSSIERGGLDRDIQEESQSLFENSPYSRVAGYGTN